MKKQKYPIHSDFKKWSKMNPPLNRAVLPIVQKSVGVLSWFQRSEKGLQAEKKKIPVEGGYIQAIWYTPTGVGKGAPCILFCHGGGFVLPAAPYHFRLAREYAKQLQCKVLFVQYRLSPKHRFPVPMNDCFTAYEWLLDNAEILGIDEKRIAVCGDSAGGALAAAVALKARDNGLRMPCGQMLIYPVVGGSLATPSMQKYTDTPMCNSRDMIKYYRLFFGAEEIPTQKYAAPIREESLADLPKAYIETAEFDCLRDEGEAYANRLKQSGVEVEYYATRGTIHGFDIVKKSEIVDEVVRRRIAFLRRIFTA